MLGFGGQTHFKAMALSPFARELLTDCPDARILTNVLRIAATYSCDENGIIMAVVSEIEKSKQSQP